jgi:transcription elongation factor Elf1
LAETATTGCYAALIAMVMTRRTVIDFADLRFLSVECGKCGVKTVLDIERLLDVERPGRSTIPPVCPSCETSFETLNHAIGKFVRAYAEVVKSPNRVRFEIDDPAGVEKASTQN